MIGWTLSGVYHALLETRTLQDRTTFPESSAFLPFLRFESPKRPIKVLETMVKLGWNVSSGHLKAYLRSAIRNGMPRDEVFRICDQAEGKAVEGGLRVLQGNMQDLKTPLLYLATMQCFINRGDVEGAEEAKRRLEAGLSAFPNPGYRSVHIVNELLDQLNAGECGTVPLRTK